ncbi:hypothetical protein F2P81_022339 [Scophthalmus maximus]|uniref:Uncharacterized protein n=1 Tax=Scophthalmus maximus TaxID=52904 RepID=A0A6A4RZZ7_SCOMX|nr:hypothetical protein F2P81_022339 [Scophthalmus maximus]
MRTNDLSKMRKSLHPFDPFFERATLTLLAPDEKHVFHNDTDLNDDEWLFLANPNKTWGFKKLWSKQLAY